MSAHCDLGSRYPLERCPTRIMKKSGYERLEKPQPNKKIETRPKGYVSLYKLAKINNIKPQNLRSQAIKFFRRHDFPNGVTLMQAEKLLRHYLVGGYK